ncbi:hypothetical protein PAF17_08095 [Paracoccus sp. Z330]|uniref:Uncharacterized protein n=1 Tax=Paracoccus onchidii TaxID=3017813 RepID=A0ABT4ZES1_9RHOB|nr:hypothetical protein [Paracoccus onchidii]MDB6177473.1 hypothetical protein [Paracoccus onchidii]
MSHNEQDPTRSARKHRPALMAIALAVAAAIILYFVFPFAADDQDQNMTVPPDDAQPVQQ